MYANDADLLEMEKYIKFNKKNEKGKAKKTTEYIFRVNTNLICTVLLSLTHFFFSTFYSFKAL